jgi:photosystem II stability/assembly factor-like uncharacterized protein
MALHAELGFARMRALMAVASGVLLLLAGCGGATGSSRPAKRSDRLVDFSQKPPYVNALDVDSATGDFLLTTNRGFFRIDAKTRAVERVKGTIAAGSASSTVGTFLELLSTGPGRLLGSGHPDTSGALPPFLGLISSDDGGRSWKSVSRLGEADFHKIVLKHDRIYGFDAVLGAMLISEDGGHRFVERFTPPGLVIDFEVDPEDPDHLLAATEKRLVRSTDGGKHWRPIDTGDGIRLVWPAQDALYRAQRDGTVERSRDGGGRWERVGKVPGEPCKFKALGPEKLDLALSDGTIVATEDGGKEWKTAFRPRPRDGDGAP